MLKRIRNYQKYCWKAMNTNKSSEESIIVFFVVFFATISVGTMGAVRLNLLDIAMVCALLGLSCQYNQGMNNRMLRQVPASDRFAIFNLIILTLYTFLFIFHKKAFILAIL